MRQLVIGDCNLELYVFFAIGWAVEGCHLSKFRVKCVSVIVPASLGVYQTIVATWGTPWAVELLLLVYRYVSCCLSPTHQNHLHS